MPDSVPAVILGFQSGVISSRSPISSFSGFSHSPKLSRLAPCPLGRRSAGLTGGTWSVQGEAQVQSCPTLDCGRGIGLP